MLLNTKYRNRDFKERCRQVVVDEMLTGYIPSVRRVAVLTVFGSAPGFYVDYQHTYNALCKRAKAAKAGVEVAGSYGLCEERMREIEKRVAALMAEKGWSRARALTEVINNGRAPRFYMTVRDAMNLVRENFPQLPVRPQKRV